MQIGFVTSGLPFNGRTLETQALGGAETACYYMAKCLSARGHKVQVFNECDQPGTYDGVEYFHRQQFLAQSAVVPFDVLICSRWHQFLSGPSISGLRVLWLHDMPTDKAAFMPGLWQTDLLLGLSQYHIDQYCKDNETLRQHFWKTKNGVDLEMIEGCIRPKVPKKLIYTSRPERGLQHLLSPILPMLINADPEIKLHFCFYDLGKAMELPEHVKAVHQACERLAALHPQNVIPMGHLPKKALYEQMSSAQALVYPSVFSEISCISILESCACGLPQVTSDYAALSETCGPGGTKIPGQPPDKAYCEAFVFETLKLLNEPEYYAQKVDAGKKWITDQGYTWPQIAESWEKKFTEMLDERTSKNRAKITKELLRTNNVVLAKHYAKKNNQGELLKTADYGINWLKQQEYDPGDVVDRYAKAKDRFHRMMQLIRHHCGEVKSLLDYHCNDVAFGIAYKAQNPDARVVLLAIDEEVAKRLSLYVEKCDVQVEIETELDVAEKFDVVHLEEILDKQIDPRSFLGRLMSSRLNDGGTVVFSSVYGDDCLKFSELPKPKRLWNFDAGDFNDLFHQEGNRFNLMFHDSRNRPVYEQIHGYWLGALDKTTKFGRIDLTGKVRRTRPYQKLTAVMIAKDSEQWLPVSIGAIRNVVDEICLVDTGSSDNTVEVVKNLGARVIEEPFDNFSASRNISIGMAEDADWLLMVDTDERLAFADMIRKYLHSTIFEGFIIRQNQLTIDAEKTARDIPVRLWRNRPHYRYTGMIHEHVEDTSKKPYDQELDPVLILPDVDIAHYGYTTENERRWKCSRRNMNLLIRDVEESATKGRMLTWTLVMRDYINICKWKLERSGPFKNGSYEHQLLEACVTTYHHFFADGVNKYAHLAFASYQDALMMMAACNLLYGELRHPPFQVEFALAGGVGGLDPEKTVKPETYWFLTHEEFVQFLRIKGASLVTRMGISHTEKYQEDLAFQKLPNVLELPETAVLLGHGLHEM